MLRSQSLNESRRPPAQVAQPQRSHSLPEKSSRVIPVHDPHTDRVLHLDPIAARLDAFTSLRIGGIATPRLMGHMFSLGGSTQLEGTLIKHSTDELCQALGSLVADLPRGAQRDTVLDVVAQLRRAGAWDAYGATAKKTHPVTHKLTGKPAPGLAEEMCAAIRSQHRVLLPVTVVDEHTAHAALVEVVSQSNGRYTLRVFNTSHGDRRQHGIPGTRSLLAHTDFVDIPARVIHNPRQITPLLQLAFPSGKPFSEQIAALYDWAGRHGARAPQTEPMGQGQVVGNCAWKCVAAYVRDRLPKALYLRLKLEHRTRVLEEYAAAFGTPALLTQMYTLYGAGYAVHAPFGVPVFTPVMTPVAYGQVPIGWTRTYPLPEATLLGAAQYKLGKTQQRFTLAMAQESPDSILHSDAKHRAR